MEQPPLSLEEVRARIDQIDAALLALFEERAELARAAAQAKGTGGAAGFGLQPAREAQVLRSLLALPRKALSGRFVVSLWRQIMGESLARQGPFHLTVWGGRDPGPIVDMARIRFGASPSLKAAADPAKALAAAKVRGGVAVIALSPESAWWGRLLIERSLNVFAVLPGFGPSQPVAALAVAQIAVEPSGGDETFWVTDSPLSKAAIEEALGQLGLAGSQMTQAGGLKLFSLAGYVQREDERLSRAPGELKGVIGAASLPPGV